MDVLLALAVMALFSAMYFAFVGGIGYWILGPMHRATYKIKLSTQFFVSDFIWLVASLQVALAIVVLVPIDYGDFVWIIIAGASWVGVVAIWWASITALTRARVRGPLRRATFTLIVAPMATLGTVGAFVFNLAIIVFTVDAFAAGRSAANLPWLFLLNVPAAALFFGCRWLALWVLAGHEMSPDESPS